MNIAVASGKGGTGKTTVAACLAADWDGPVTAVDLDVEEPNLHLFLKPDIIGRETAEMEVPVCDESRCTLCRACSELCQFKAISVLGEVLLTFPEMCHGCGGCMAVCPEKALTPGARELGEVNWGRAGRIDFVSGRLRVGEAMSPPLMRAVKDRLTKMLGKSAGDVIIDAPPGVSCPAVNAVMDSDVIILVTEPTPFGLHDLKLAVEAFTPLTRHVGVVINRAGVGDRSIYDYCSVTGLEILAEISFDRRIARAYSQGLLISEVLPEIKDLFTDLIKRIKIMGGTDHGVLEARYA
ncbi:MAG: ATP-binding protein [Deltaproteobacteria bacterium]|nr:ATP-binding protein [Deltaproteobacteria bacterium]